VVKGIDEGDFGCILVLIGFDFGLLIVEEIVLLIMVEIVVMCYGCDGGWLVYFSGCIYEVV